MMSKLKINRFRIIKVLSFLLLIVITDQITGKILNHLYFSQKTGQGQNLNYILSECRADILIFGNSRAQHHYDTKIISDSLNLTCYNAGIDGGHSILMPYALIKVMLNRYTPKVIIIEFDPSFVMEYRKSEYDRFSVLLPYYYIYPNLQPFIKKRSPFEQIKLLSGIYPYNSDIIGLIRMNTDIDANRKWIFNGYIPIKNKQMNESMVSIPIDYGTKARADPDKIKALENIIQLCKNKGTKLFFINSPIFQAAQENVENIAGSTKEVKDLLTKLKATSIDYSKDTRFIDQIALFADRLHLNENGATKYSQIIGSLLKNKVRINNIQ